MAFDIDALLDLWATPFPDSDEEAAERVRTMYTDPVTINGVPMSAAQLAARARMVQGTFDPATTRCSTWSRPATRSRSRSGWAVSTSVRSRRRSGILPGTGERLDVRVIDILTLTDGRISNIWMCADELGALVSADAVRWS